MMTRYCDWEIIKDGFSFSKDAYNTLGNLIIRENEWCDSVGGRFRAPVRPIEDYIQYINKNQIQSADVYMRDLSFLKECPSLTRLSLQSPVGFGEKMDYTPLYELPVIEELNCPPEPDTESEEYCEIDYSKIHGLVSLSLYMRKGMKNFKDIPTLKSLWASKFKGKNRDLTDLFTAPHLDCLWLICCGVKSLKGIEASSDIEEVRLDYCRSLEDISALESAKSTLRHLQIDTCGKIKDFSVLEKLEKLEVLVLTGNNTIPNLNFLKKLPNLQYFKLTMNVEDGDLTPCLNIPCMGYVQNRRHYNLKNEDFQSRGYTQKIRCPESELWRKWSYICEPEWYKEIYDKKARDLMNDTITQVIAW